MARLPDDQASEVIRLAEQELGVNVSTWQRAIISQMYAHPDRQLYVIQAPCRNGRSFLLAAAEAQMRWNERALSRRRSRWRRWWRRITMSRERRRELGLQQQMLRRRWHYASLPVTHDVGEDDGWWPDAYEWRHDLDAPQP